jgi:NADH-quinone oxidoreductase subunit I
MSQAPVNSQQTIKRSGLSQWFYNIFDAISTIQKGMSITMRALLKTMGMRKISKGYDYGSGPITISYPDVKDAIPLISRNRLFNHVEGCIACNQCAVICPVECIDISSRKKTPDEDLDAKTPAEFGSKPLKLKLLKFSIDEALCCFCGLCTEVCPTECLVHTPEFEYSKFDRDKLYYDYLNFDDDNPFPKA